METNFFKEHKYLLISIVIGLIAIICAVITYVSISFSTPGYEFIKHNQIVTNLSDLDEDNEINDEKYYVLSDDFVTFPETEDQEEDICLIYLDKIKEDNPSFSHFKIMANVVIEASDQSYEEDVIAKNVGFSASFVHSEKLNYTYDSVSTRVDAYPRDEIQFQMDFDLDTEYDAIKLSVLGNYKYADKTIAYPTFLEDKNSKDFYFGLLAY